MVGRDIALLFHDRGTGIGWVVSSTPRPHFTPEKDPVPSLQDARWAPGPVWTGGKSRPNGIRSPDRPARSESLYRLSYRPTYLLLVSRLRKKGTIILLLLYAFMSCTGTTDNFYPSWNIMNNVILSEREENFTTSPFCCEETTKSFKTIRRHMFLRMRTKS